MDHTQHAAGSEGSGEPPSASAPASLAVEAFGLRTGQYFTFLDALLDGLLDYELRLGGGCIDGQTPVPAA